MRGRYPPLMWAPKLVRGALHGALLVLSLHLERERKRDERAVRLSGYEDEEDWRGGEKPASRGWA